MLKLQDRFPVKLRLHPPIYNMHEALREYWTWGWGCDQSIGSTVSDVIGRSWLWSTSTSNSPLGYFSRLLITAVSYFSRWPPHYRRECAHHTTDGSVTTTLPTGVWPPHHRRECDHHTTDGSVSTTPPTGMCPPHHWRECDHHTTDGSVSTTPPTGVWPPHHRWSVDNLTTRHWGYYNVWQIDF